MPETIFALPVSVEQVALVIRQMGQRDRERLFELVPDLRQIVDHLPGRTAERAQTSVARLQAEVQMAVKRPLLSDDPFLGDLTLGQYHSLADEDKARLWDKWAEVDLMDLEEQEVAADTLSAR